jgi:hypothetical protein
VPLRDTGGFKAGCNLRPVPSLIRDEIRGSYRTKDTCESTIRDRERSGACHLINRVRLEEILEGFKINTTVVTRQLVLGRYTANLKCENRARCKHQL